MHLKSKLIFLVFILSLYSCGDKKVDTTAAKAEMKAREVRVIPEARVLEKALELGNEALTKLQSSDSPLDQIEFKVSLFDQPNNLSGKEKQLFEAYQYNITNQIVSDVNVQNLKEEKILLFTSPFKDSLGSGMLSIYLPRSFVVSKIED